jgi:hypothetical protein
MSAREPIVAIGFLTQHDLHVLGAGFDRLFPVAQDQAFDDLLRKLDSVEATPHGEGVLIRKAEPPKG